MQTSTSPSFTVNLHKHMHTCTHMYTNTCNAPTHSKINFTVIGIPYVFKGFYAGEQCACQIPNQLEFKLPAISDQLQEG